MSTSRKIDPFKVKKAAPKRNGDLPSIQTPKMIADAIDLYREAQDKVKHFEGEAAVYKDAITAFSRFEFAKKALNGDTRNFKMFGEQSHVMYIAMDASSGLTDEDIEAVEAEFGEKAAKELTENDYRTLKFNPDVLAEHYDLIVKTLQKLPNQILANLFTPMLMKTSHNVVLKAGRYAKNEDDLQKLMRLLKVKNYIR